MTTKSEKSDKKSPKKPVGLLPPGWSPYQPRPVTTDPTYGFPTTLNRHKIGRFIIEVNRSDLNGDPDTNGPRIWPNDHGFVTDVCIKSILRSYARQLGQNLYIMPGTDLGETQAAEATPNALLEKHFDLRAFGGVLTTFNVRARGCIQFTFAESVLPIATVHISTTRMSGHWKEERPVAEGDDGEGEGVKKLGSTMGGREVVLHGLYVGWFEYLPFEAAQNGLTTADLELFYECLFESFNFIRSTSRKDVRFRRVDLFDFPSARGREPGWKTAERLQVKPIADLDHEPDSYGDYEVTVDLENLRPGTTYHRWDAGQVSHSEIAAAAK